MSSAIEIELFGGPADGQTMAWRYPGHPSLQVPIRGPNGLSFANYAINKQNAAQYLFTGLEKP